MSLDHGLTMIAEQYRHGNTMELDDEIADSRHGLLIAHLQACSCHVHGSARKPYGVIIQGGNKGDSHATAGLGAL